MRLHFGAAMMACMLSVSGLCAPLTRPDTTLLRLTDALTSKTTRNPNKASTDVGTIQGIARPVISQHPAAAEKPLVQIDFTAIKLPAIKSKEQIVLTGWVGIREGFKPSVETLFDGVKFIIKINGKTAFALSNNQQKWVPFKVDLKAYAGKTVTISLLTDPQKNSALDWAVWGQPQLIIKGRPSPLEFLNIPQLQVKNLQQRKLPERISVSISDEGASAVGLLDPTLELSALAKTVPQAKGQAPVIVAGEGSDPDNHTVVRVLNEFSMPVAQFLAFPATVTGGVTVRRLQTQTGIVAILTAPASNDTVRNLRLYTQDGLLIREITPPAAVNPPYALVTGRFDPNSKADQIAITGSMYDPSSPVCIIDELGKPIKTLLGAVPAVDSSSTVWLTLNPGQSGDSLICQHKGADAASRINPVTAAVERISLPESLRELRLNPSAFEDGSLWASGNDALQSIAFKLSPANEITSLDLGKRENNFYIQWYWPFGNPLQDGKYIKFSEFLHLRTDGSQYGNLDKILAGDFSTLDDVPSKSRIDSYATSIVGQWEPCYTHRQSRHAAPKMMEAIDPQSKLPAYAMLTRTNKMALYGEFDTVDFFSSTYATGSPILDGFYHRPNQAFLRALFANWRKTPEHIAMLEPNHEHEIAVEADGTYGDYNPLNIQNFADYLRQTEGDQLTASAKKLGAPITTLFDAPRQNDRGAWDAYEKTNPMFASWVNFNRTVVNRFIAQTLANALAAGFPPELLCTHQIPDTYAIGNLSAFSNVTSRITPIDWALNTGAAYGFTRYGVWYTKQHEALQDAWRAGQNMISVGEYQALTPNAEDAYKQLKYMFEHGVYSVHCMQWPKDYDEGFNKTMDEAIRRLMLESDKPRPGVTGGVGEIQIYRKQGKPIALAGIGTGKRTGLIKAVNEAGEWTGDVYVTPFHARIIVQQLVVKQNSVGPLPRMDSGMQVEITGVATATQAGSVRVQVMRNGSVLPGLGAVLPVSAGQKQLRFTLRTQYPLEGLSIKLVPEQGVSLSGVAAVRSKEHTPRLPLGVFGSSAHQGGVHFAVLE